MKIYENLTELIGNTPLLKLNKYKEKYNLKADILAKLEYFNPLGSVKDRVAYSMIKDAEEKNIINKNSTIIEPTSGNTGIGLAFVCASRGYKLILVMPESMSIERRKLVKALGAEVVLTEAKSGMKGAIAKANELNKEIENSIILQQFDNKANPKAHRESTALEILNDTDGNVDIVVAGIGTGGTITGIAQILKEKNKDITIIGVEPENSPIITENRAGAHKIQGIGAGFIPSILELGLIDKVMTVSNEQAIETARELGKTEGVLVGISSGASVCIARKLAELEENKGKNIVAICPDTGERYLSTELFE